MTRESALRRVREAVGLTQQQAAAALGCSPSMISKAETRSSRLGPDLAMRVLELWPGAASAESVSLADLLQAPLESARDDG